MIIQTSRWCHNCLQVSPSLPRLLINLPGCSSFVCLPSWPDRQTISAFTVHIFSLVLVTLNIAMAVLSADRGIDFVEHCDNKGSERGGQTEQQQFFLLFFSAGD